MKGGAGEGCSKVIQGETFTFEEKEVPVSYFSECSKLTTVELSGVTTIKESAFEGTGLIRIVIPESCKLIEDSAFARCNSLTSITFQLPSFPPGEEQKLTLKNGVFQSCSALKNISIKVEEQEHDVVENGELTETAKKPDFKSKYIEPYFELTFFGTEPGPFKYSVIKSDDTHLEELNDLFKP